MKWFVLIIWIILFKNLFSQSKKYEWDTIKVGTPINSGFVFIDGKYIEPPYIVEQKEPGKVFINNIQVQNYLVETDTVVNPYKIDSLPTIPKSFNKNTTFDEMKKLRYNSRWTYLEAILNYYYTHYPYKEAYKKIVNEIKQFPNVKNIESNGPLKIELNNGETQRMEIGLIFEKKFYEKWGIHSKRKLPSKKDIYKKNEFHIKAIMYLLNSNDLLSFTPSNINLRFSYGIIFENQLLVNDTTSYARLANSLIPFKYSENFLMRLKEFKLKLLEDYKKRNIQIEDSVIKKIKSMGQNKSQNKIKNKFNIAFSPFYSSFSAFCPSTWDLNAFGNSWSTEIQHINNYVSNYTYSNVYEIFDNSPNDDIIPYTYDFIKNELQNTGILYIGTHGRPLHDENPEHLIDNGLFLAFTTSANSIWQWDNNDDLIYPTQIIVKPQEWDPNIEMWGAFALSTWADQYWKNDLTQNKVFTILSSCYSFTNGWVNSCSGGIAFGYGDETYPYDIESNNNDLFKLLTGIKKQGNKREAVNAYNAMPYHAAKFNYVNGFNITLCPAPKSYTTTVTDFEGDAYFEIDTYCDATLDPNQALVPEVVSGFVIIENREWVDVTNGMSNKIKFHYSTDVNFRVKMNVNSDYIRSYSSICQGHPLDFDKKSPIEPSNYYYFEKLNFIPNVNFSYQQQPNSFDVQFNASSNLGYNVNYSWDFGDETNLRLALM